MPPELGKLTKLQTLTRFVAAVTGPDSSDVAELQRLNLSGLLEVYQVENVIEAEAKVANLGKKKNLRELTLSWTSACDSKVLNNFEPHDGLQVLRLYCYGGKCIGMLQNMVEIHLYDCPRLQVLFRCGTSFTFPKLKQLALERLFDFERWCEINERQEELKIFPVLEKLFISYCRKLIALPEATLLREPCSAGGYRLVRSAFPTLKVLELEDFENFQRWDAAVEGEEILFPLLEKLAIQKCPKLIDLPEAPLLPESCSGCGHRLERSAFPALKVLEVKHLESFQRWDAAVEVEEILFPQLEKLLIQKCPKLIDLPEAPKLCELEIEDGNQEILRWVDIYLSSLTKLILKLENTETSSKADIELVDSKEKWNQKSPLTVMELRCCNSFFGSGPLKPWGNFVNLEVLDIDRCDMLVHWPEEVFQRLVSLRRLVITDCENLIGYAEAPLEPSASERSQHLPGLEVLQLHFCANLVEMFNVPASIKRMTIGGCQKLESIFGKQQQGMSELVQGSSSSEAITLTAVSELSSSPMNIFLPCLEDLYLSGCDSLPAGLNLPPSLKTVFLSRCSSIQVLICQQDELPKPQVTTSINVPEPSAAAKEHSLPPCLESLFIEFSGSMFGGILHLPMSLRKLEIWYNCGLTSLVSLSGKPPSLEDLHLHSCSTLASLPNEPQAYMSLQHLRIVGCPAVKKLPRCLQQQLGSIKHKYLDAHYEVRVISLKPKTWKEIPRLVREQRRQAHRN